MTTLEEYKEMIVNTFSSNLTNFLYTSLLLSSITCVCFAPGRADHFMGSCH